MPLPIQNTESSGDAALQKALKSIGLTDNELLLFLTSLHEGPMSIAKLSDKIGIQRPNVYKIILELEKRGLAKFSDRKWRTRSFVVEPPTKIREILNSKAKELSIVSDEYLQTLPSLLALYSQGDRETKVKMYKYESQWMDLFFESLDETQGNIEWFGNYASWLQFMPKDQEELWIRKRIEKRAPIKLLLLPSKEADTLMGAAPELLRECRILSWPTHFDCSFQLYANKVIFWQPNTPLILQIEDEYLVKMLRSMFFMLWGTKNVSNNDVE